MEKEFPKERYSIAIKDGFDEDPSPDEVKEGKPLYVYRVHGSSALIGRFFFTPQIEGTPRMNWTADLLEKELNAALWDNDFRYLAKFRVLKGVKYEIGPIAHDKYRGIDGTDWAKKNPSNQMKKAFVQYSYFRNENLFYQVKTEGLNENNWREYLNLVEDTPIDPGRFHRVSTDDKPPRTKKP